MQQILRFISLCLLGTIVLCQQCSVDIQDPLWNRQWYLNKSPYNDYDMNVIPAWRRCVNGTGVTVAVVDNGVQDHEDLNINRDLDFSSDRRPRTTQSLKHGTRIAGIIAAKKNRLHNTGVAFGAEIADVRVYFDTFDPRALVDRNDIIDIYSCSFANFHTGTRTYPLSQGIRQSFIRGTARGRGNKGSIFVVGTGNSGDETHLIWDSCAYDGLMNSRFVIPVAGIQHDLTKVPTGMKCTSVMVAAFTAKAGEQDRRWKLNTLDVNNSSTDVFSQNSAAIPMVSGAVALALSARPQLTYRDVMHLLVQTSRNDMQGFAQEFQANGANFRYSRTFGFGLLNIGNLVERGINWQNVPEMKTCTANLPSEQVAGISHSFIVDSCQVSYTEHVEVRLRIEHRRAGRIRWYLVSPMGTRSMILPGRRFDSTRLLSITVVTVQMWGENPSGQWRLEPEISTANNLVGRISGSVKIHGFICQNNNHIRCLAPTTNVSPSWSVWSAWSQCTEQCGGGTKTRTRQCSSPGACADNSQEQTHCNTQACQAWSAWSDWSACSVGCGGGTETRTRNCIIERLCTGDTMEERECNSQNCSNTSGDTPYNGWSEWSNWSPCSDSCRRTRIRQCYREGILSPGYCGNADFIETGNCEQHRCRGDTPYNGWSEWSAWSACRNCRRSRIRQCYREGILSPGNCGIADFIESENCELHRCIASWGEWTQWSRCSAPCGGGSKRRSRNCYRNGEETIDVHCAGTSSEFLLCNNRPCESIGTWSEWGQWGMCLENCQQNRSRTCSGGQRCPGIRKKYRSCSNGLCNRCRQNQFRCNDGSCIPRSYTCDGINNDCPDNSDETLAECATWSEWAGWSQCSRSCGRGTRTRTRECHGRGFCLGFRQQRDDCNTQACAVTGCTDRNPNCPRWSEDGSCEMSHIAYIYCRHSCNTC